MVAREDVQKLTPGESQIKSKTKAKPKEKEKKKEQDEDEPATSSANVDRQPLDPYVDPFHCNTWASTATGKAPTPGL